MAKGDIVVVSFTGTDLVSGRIFDTTNEAEAKKSGIYREGAIYREIPVVVGSGDLLKGMDNVLAGMKSGEEKVFTLQPEDAFGERRADLIRVVPMRDFKKEKIMPFQGMPVEVNGMQGRVQTVSGGRVRIDFNQELAGRELQYRLKVERVLTKPQEIADAFLEKLFPLKAGAGVEKPLGKFIAGRGKEGGVLEIKAKGMPKEFDILKEVFSKTMTENVKEIKEVRFVEEFSGNGKSEAKKTEKPAAKAKK
ncbi:MAG: FKBP-type peptidyl-prolyl cis-trans isomerase [Candidatus Diapherotrites archaeon]|nr:FKBP-type peptidyl-prolyl cis-trans isomerase [Candidatus Micrarchaeota archaeon]MBU1939865.1 FKBP-type peptidyl-prolyl cis-trans isomerase [Candidatus Micrarchaeota archaeon]